MRGNSHFVRRTTRKMYPDIILLLIDHACVINKTAYFIRAPDPLEACVNSPSRALASKSVSAYPMS